MTDFSLSPTTPIGELLPHQAPMILIDKLIDISDTKVHTQVLIQADGLFFDAATNTVPGYVGIEYMAQSIAAWSGYHAKQQGKDPDIGFLLGSRRYHSDCAAFSLGQVLDIHAEQLMENNGMAAFYCQIMHQGKEIAHAQLNAFVPSPEQLNDMLAQQ
ncbi:hotdog family protein [Vibrio aphrogenes]|uniref:hotdog family protein n=1 Tax=Vibrio aphrogenes TaxID=1891186 RepID=UPI000B364164|nr:hotdog family protein [Vibrio aphrogenes]